MTLVIRNDGSGLFLFPELLLTGVRTGHGVPKYLPVFRTTLPPVFRKSAEKNAEKASFWPKNKEKMKKTSQNIPFYKGKEERKR